jgi:PAS domain-containing protein
MTDPQGVVTNWNAGAQHILGCTRPIDGERCWPDFKHISRSQLNRTTCWL